MAIAAEYMELTVRIKHGACYVIVQPRFCEEHELKRRAVNELMKFGEFVFDTPSIEQDRRVNDVTRVGLSG